MEQKKNCFFLGLHHTHTHMQTYKLNLTFFYLISICHYSLAIWSIWIGRSMIQSSPLWWWWWRWWYSNILFELQIVSNWFNLHFFSFSSSSVDLTTIYLKSREEEEKKSSSSLINYGYDDCLNLDKLGF